MNLKVEGGEINMVKEGYGKKDGSQRGSKEGGGGRNRTSNCRHPKIKKERKE